MKNKKAMSLAEVLVCLAVIGILTMILVPILTKTTANKEKFLYKKAVNTMQNAVSAVMNDNGVVNSSNFWPELSDNGQSFREAVASKIITLDGVSKTTAGTTTASDPDFRSNDGMLWWGLPDSWPEESGKPAKYVDVNVDVNGEGGTNLSSEDANADANERPDRLKIRVMKDGRVLVPEYTDDNSDWSFETDYLTSQKVDK